MRLDNKTARSAQPGESPVPPMPSVASVGGLAVAREVVPGRRRARRRDHAAIAHPLDELRHVVVERGVLLIEIDPLLEETDAGPEIIADQRLESALDGLACEQPAAQAHRGNTRPGRAPVALFSLQTS